MPNQTPNYNLVKPLKTENYNIDIFNGNADIIDSALKNNEDKLSNLGYENLSRTITVGNSQMFSTVQAAINSIKKYIQYNVNIKIECDPGTYNENIKIGGFYGGGTISINTNKSPINLQSIILEKNSIEIILNNLTINYTSDHCVAVVDCKDITIASCGIGGKTSTSSGVFCMNSNVIINNTSITGKYSAIVGYENSNIYSDSNTGIDNFIVLNVGSNSTIGKNGTQPTGTTAEVSTGGGVIR